MTFKDEIRGWPARWIDEWHERAAIRQYEGGATRAKADYEAWKEVKRAMERER